MGDVLDNLKKFKKELDAISPTFCVAKWKQVTMHLESGLTHSCHHPKAHLVPLDELEIDVSALHNTNYKKRMRSDMLKGEIVSECEYCNRIEQSVDKTERGFFSDRVLKSYEPWAKKHIPDIVKNGPYHNSFPSYFEVSFSSVCNCSCIYCSPTFSTGWTKEVEKFGPYDVSVNTRSLTDSEPPAYLGKDYNPYIEAFWKWWPELYNNLEFFRITGGEPLLSKDTFKILDYIIGQPKKELQLGINSNFCIAPKIFNKFIEKMKRIAEHLKVTVYTSCEAKGEKANYIRPGMDYNQWLGNCRKYLSEIPNSNLTFMCTYNILSITSFEEFLKDVLKLKQEFPTRVTIDIPYLMNPPYLQATIITKDYVKYIENTITYMYKNPDVSSWKPLCGKGFWDFETSKMKRIYDMIKYTSKDDGCMRFRRDFSKFFDQHDKRYNTNFLEIFPEYTDFYYQCKDKE